MDIFLLSLSFKIFLGAVLSGLCIGSIWFYGRAIYSAIDYLFHADPVLTSFHPSVTVLQPLTELTAATYANLLSFCQQDYPHYQTMFIAPAANHASIAVAKQLMQQFPDRNMQLVAGTDRLANLKTALAQARGKLLVIADSDTCVDTNYLQQIVQPFRYAAVGVVICPYRISGTGWLAPFWALRATTELHSRTLMARCAGVQLAFESAIAIRKSLLTQAADGAARPLAAQAGLSRLLGTELAPGLFGYRTVLSDQVVNRVINHSDYDSCWRDGLQYGLVFSLLLWGLTGGSTYGWLVLGCTWMARLMMAWAVGVVHDLVSFGIWCSERAGDLIRLTQSSLMSSTMPNAALASEPMNDRITELTSDFVTDIANELVTDL
jgi:ceramide glucosyltransferase